jgi:hypothetical protein
MSPLSCKPAAVLSVKHTEDAAPHVESSVPSHVSAYIVSHGHEDSHSIMLACKETQPVCQACQMPEYATEKYEISGCEVSGDVRCVWVGLCFDLSLS